MLAVAPIAWQRTAYALCVYACMRGIGSGVRYGHGIGRRRASSTPICVCVWVYISALRMHMRIRMRLRMRMRTRSGLSAYEALCLCVLRTRGALCTCATSYGPVLDVLVYRVSAMANFRIIALLHLRIGASHAGTFTHCRADILAYAWVVGCVLAHRMLTFVHSCIRMLAYLRICIFLNLGIRMRVCAWDMFMYAGINQRRLLLAYTQ
jgi:hypothetical protein